MEPFSELLDFVEETHTYYLFGIEIPSVSQILKFAGYQKGIDFIDPIYASRGSFVHYISEMIDQDGQADYSIIPPEWVPFVTAYEWFKADTNYEIEKSEYKVFSPEHLYCGTADREYTGAVQGDIKTGYYQAWHELQLAGYMNATGCTKGLDIYLTKDGTFKVREVKDIDLATKRFLMAADGYWFGRKRDRARLIKLIKEYK